MTLLALVMLAGVLVGTPGVVASQDSDTQPWISVERVLVNKLGGVSVEGLHSCAALYDQLRSTGITYRVEVGPGQWEDRTITATVDDIVVIGANPDNYTVSQPAGRRNMIQVTHGSSRLQWCYSNAPEGFFPWEPQCGEPGEPCRWVTDRYGYSGTAPLFDYSPDGRFKTGDLAVAVTQVGYWIEVHHLDGTWEGASVSDESFASQVIRAVAYR